MYDLVGNIIAYESGELTDQETLELFSYLISTGLCWTLQGHYGRTAVHLIDSGYIGQGGNILIEIGDDE